MAATKKPKLTRTPLAEPPPLPPEILALHPSLRSAERSPRTGLVIGSLPLGGPGDHRGFSCLVVIDPGASEPRRLGDLEANLGPPSLSPDESHVIVPCAGPPSVLQVSLATGERRTVWGTGTPPDGYGIHAAVHVGADHVALFSGFAFALMRRDPSGELSHVSSLGSAKEPIKGFAVTRALDGRVLIVRHATKQTLVGLVDGELRVLAELPAKSGSWAVLADGARVVQRDAAGAFSELTSLAELVD